MDEFHNQIFVAAVACWFIVVGYGWLLSLSVLGSLESCGKLLFFFFFSFSACLESVSFESLKVSSLLVLQQYNTIATDSRSTQQQQFSYSTITAILMPYNQQWFPFPTRFQKSHQISRVVGWHGDAASSQNLCNFLFFLGSLDEKLVLKSRVRCEKRNGTNSLRIQGCVQF